MYAVGGELGMVGREDELADIGLAVRRLAASEGEGEGGFRAYAGDPGIGKTTMLLAVKRAAREAGIPTVSCDRVGGPQALVEVALNAQARGDAAVVLIDDLHGLAGGEAVEALDRLLELTATGRLLVAVAYRPRQLSLPMSAVLGSVCARPGIRRPAPFTLEQTRRLIGDRPDLAAIHRDSLGVPLYARILADPTHAGAGQLLAELATLPPDELATAHAAAVLCRPFAPEMLLAVSDLDPDTTRSALDRLVARDIIRASPSGPLLAFRHRTLATAAYHTATVSRRSALHLRADRELERRGAPAIMRAGHVANSFDLTRPGRHRTLALAARQALSTDPVAASGWLEVAQARLTRNHPYWPETQLLLAKAHLHLGRLDLSRATFLALDGRSSPGDETDAALHTGRIERLLGRYPEAAAFIRTGLSLAGTASARAAGLAELAAIAADHSEYGESDRLATEASRIAHAAGDQPLECIALSGAAWARTALGDPAAAGVAAMAAARLADAMVDAAAVQNIDCLRLLGQSELLLDQLADARRHLVRGVRLARRTGQRHVLPNLLKALAELELRLGRLDRAGRALDEAEPLAAEAGVVPIQTIMASVRAGTLVWQRPSAQAGDSVAAAERATGYAAGAKAGLAWPGQAQVALGEALAFAGQPGHAGRIIVTAGGGRLLPRVAAHRRVRWWEILTIAAAADGDLAAAHEYAELAVEAVERAPTVVRRGFAYRARALVDAAQGDTAAALAAGEIAAASFAAAGALLDLGRAHVIIASACIDAGRFEGLDGRLAMAGALARRCHAERLAEQVEAQLARLPEGPAQPDWQAALTPRERDIAMLAGQALASTAIAAKLHLSVRTVESHLGRIYRKLGISGRVALANLLNAGPSRSPKSR